MIEVRLFATLRQGRQKVYQVEHSCVNTVQDIMDAYFGIDTDGSEEEEILEGETIPAGND